MHHPTDRITHTRAFVKPVVEHWLEREIAHHTMNEHSNHITTSHSTKHKQGRKEMFYLTMHSTHFYFLFTDIWYQTYGKGPQRQLKRKLIAATT